MNLPGVQQRNNIEMADFCWDQEHILFFLYSADYT
jgi:hypothetical protein